MKLFQIIVKLLVSKRLIGKKGCPVCDNPNVICTGFEGFNSDYSGPFINLKELKIGRMVQCASCKTMWLVDNSQSHADTVSQNQINVVTQWNNKELKIKPEFTKVLFQIGCTPPDHYGNLKEFISIHCKKCKLENGEIIENAVISIQKNRLLDLFFIIVKNTILSTKLSPLNLQTLRYL